MATAYLGKTTYLGPEKNYVILLFYEYKVINPHP